MVAEGYGVRYAAAYCGFKSFVKSLCGGLAGGDVAGVDYDVWLLFVEYAVHVGSGVGGLRLSGDPMDVGELYDFQFAFFVEAYALRACAG